MKAQDLENEIAAWRARFPQYEYRSQDDCVSLKPDHSRYGCHCDLDEREMPDDCVFDSGRIQDCRNAQRLHSQGKGKADCSEWRPIEVIR